MWDKFGNHPSIRTISNASITLTHPQIKMQTQLDNTELTWDNIKCMLCLWSSFVEDYLGDLVCLEWLLVVVNVVFPATRPWYFTRTTSHILLGHSSLLSILRLSFTVSFSIYLLGTKMTSQNPFLRFYSKTLRVSSFFVMAKLLAPFSPPAHLDGGKHPVGDNEVSTQERNMTKILISFAMLVLV